MDEQTEGRHDAAASTRKLTTIFSADVQGYSRLMQADEEGTLATLKEYRDAMARLIAAHEGRVVNTWGDGLIAEFASVVKAVQAAIDVQNELANRNAGRGDGARMQFRIGLNLGDVIVEGDDIYGDGVNIAARLQAEARPGGILISNTVYDQVRNKVAVGFEFLGNLDVKNIEEGVPSYAVRIGEDRRQNEEPSPRVEEPPKRTGDRDAVPRDYHDTLHEAPAAFLDRFGTGRSAAVLAAIGLALVAVNLLTGGGYFWARWPLLAMAVAFAFGWAGRTEIVDRRLLVYAIIGAMLVAINLFSWGGGFWAQWPLLGLAIAGGIRWALRGSKRG